jgi:hypothetical protein
MRLLLINPKFSESFWSSEWAIREILPGKRAVSPPLGLATLAAPCPTNWQVEIVDENVEPVPRDPQADIVGVCGMGVQFPRQKELLKYYRDRGHYVIAGGSYAVVSRALRHPRRQHHRRRGGGNFPKVLPALRGRRGEAAVS